jgi:anti-anti-sigma regulatory factor
MTSTVLGFRSRGSAAVIALPEQPQVGTIVSLRSRSERALNAGHRWIGVDLRAVEHINTPTLAELCVALRRITAHGHTVAIIGPDARVQWVLELCAIDGLELHRTLKSALDQSRASQRERSRRHLLARARPSLKRSSARP